MADAPNGTWIVVQEFHDTERGSTSTVATGPFPTEDEAGDWMDSQPEDTALSDASVWFINTPTAIEKERV